MSTLRTNTLQNAAGSKSVPVDTVVDGTAKAWVNFNGTGTVAIRAAFNVSSITDNGVGDYTVNFTTAMADANYSTVAMGDWATMAWTTLNTSAAAPTATAVRIQARNSATTLVDSAYMNVAIFR